MKPSRAILNHSQYDADDYAYLVAKGWTPREILARWNEEAARGAGPCRWSAETARAKLAAVTGRRLLMQHGWRPSPRPRLPRQAPRTALNQ